MEENEGRPWLAARTDGCLTRLIPPPRGRVPIVGDHPRIEGNSPTRPNTARILREGGTAPYKKDPAASMEPYASQGGIREWSPGLPARENVHIFS